MSDQRFPPRPDDPDGDDGVPPELATVGYLLVDDALWTEPPADMEDRVVAEITRARLAQLDEVGRRPQPRRRRVWWTAGAGLATAVAAVLALFVFVPDLGQRFAPGDGRRLELAGTELATAATAIAMVESTPTGEAITLTVDDLGPAPEGYFYQAWVRGERGLVSIGTFHMRGGDDPVELWSGVDLADYPTMSVTLEPEDGDERSSGEVLLRGEIPGG